MRHRNIVIIAGVLALLSSSVRAEEIQATKVGLEDALQIALTHSPRLKSSKEAMGASRGDLRQSGLLPNPEISVEAENVLGNGTNTGFREAEITASIVQPVQLGGKRSARIKVASEQASLKQIEYQAAALDLVRDVTVAWAGAVAAEEGVRLAREQKQLAQEVLSAVTKRVNAAAESVIQKSKAEVALASSKIDLQKAERNQQAALKNFRQLVLSPKEISPSKEGFYEVAELKEITAAALHDNPDYKRLEAGVMIAQAGLALERSNAIPDMTFSVGVRDDRGANSQSLLAALSVPFPIFNRNQGAILRAGHEIAKADHDKQAVLNELKQTLLQAHNAVSIAVAESQSIRKSILPAAEKAFSQARKGYQGGRFPYLEVLDAQRTLFEVRAQRVAALLNYHMAKAEVDRLTGARSGLIQDEESAQ